MRMVRFGVSIAVAAYLPTAFTQGRTTFAFATRVNSLAQYLVHSTTRVCRRRS